MGPRPRLVPHHAPALRNCNSDTHTSTLPQIYRTTALALTSVGFAALAYYKGAAVLRQVGIGASLSAVADTCK